MTSDFAISRRAAALKPSATLAVSAKAAELRAAGKQVLSFAAGEPDFMPPTAVREAVSQMSLTKPILYAPVPGTPALRDAVAAELGAFHQRTFARDEILVSCGAKHSLANLFLASLDPGDAVVVGAPYWVSYPDMVALAGGVPITVSTRRADGWKLSPETLEPVLGAKTRFVILNSPSNPTGAGYSRDELRALGEVITARAPKAWIVTDDIYRSLVYDGFEATSAFVAMKGITDRIVAVDGVSKTYAMTGHRVGYMAGPPALISAASGIQSQMTSGAATLSQCAALAALTDPSVPAEVAAMQDAFTRRRSLILGGLAEVSGVEVQPPDGAFYVFADVSAHVGEGAKHANDVELATWLLQESLVATVPGTPFGAPGHLRLSYATDDASIEDGCHRIASAFATLPTA